MRTRLLKECLCSTYSDGFDNDWKKNFDTIYNNEQINHVMFCFSAMMYVGWKIVAYEKHCAMMKKTVNMIFCEFAKDFRESLKKL